MHADQIGRNEAADPWFEAVVEDVGDRRRVTEWLERLPPGYRERTGPGDCASDLRDADSIARGDSGDATGPADRLGLTHRLTVRPAPDDDPATFRLRRVGTEAVELTGVLPILESFGLAVTEAVPYRVAAADATGPDIAIDDFGLRVTFTPASFDPGRDGGRLVDAIDAVSAGAADVDGLNRLVTSAGLDWRQVVVLRAYRRYRRQAASPWSDAELDDTLAAFPDVARALVAYFETRFVPGDDDESRLRRSAAARDSVLVGLATVPHLQQDQVLRGFLGLVDATLRTNWYRRDADGRERTTLVLKLDSARVPELAAPRPHVETFVHGPAVEGVHLRNGPIARGGIRWSDRPGDFRTEVLGLAEAQTKKNAIIVPTGAKGGFVVRRPAAADLPAAVLAAYRDFIGGLLDVTDNLVDGKVRHPAGVVAPDGDDPYLVVAADKGTATFSDEANALSEAAGFWLGDAFASGGTRGYDHKAMGITARGAWVAVRRHFRQLGIDVQREPVRVVGVGDMSGDVFGNGMLQSRAIKLVAAFDHRHIFIDPDPDPERSYQARAALAAVGRSSWADYDLGAVSAGGGVWPRDAKEIVLGREARSALGITAEQVRPPELISAILTAPVDLLFFGGIGTFVKASDEPDSDVGDHANDGVRVTADRVRARVIAEGGNLGVTQRGRIRYSRRGGRINTDFIDNAAGVATSDKEVNVKILLALVDGEGRLAPGERDELLSAATDDVATDVLRQVDHSVAALDRSQPDSAVALDAYEALLVRLEEVGLVDRSVESLPDSEEIAGRRAAGAGLIRPELAVLLAFAKSDLVREIEASTLAADPSLLDAVTPYFPAAVRAVAGDLVGRHRLYPQLVATDVGGEMVDALGIVWAHETAAELGRAHHEVAGAYWAARQVVGAGALWAELEAASADLDADAEAALHEAVVVAVAGLARTYLRRPGPVQPATLIAEDGPLAGDPSLPPLDAAAAASLGAHRIEPERRGRFAAAGRAASVGELAPVARRCGRPLADVAMAISAYDGLPGLRSLTALLAALRPAGRWASWQARTLIDDLRDSRRRAVIEALTSSEIAPAGDPAEAVATWAAGRRQSFERAAGLIGRVEQGDTDALTVAALAVRIIGGVS